MNLSSVLVTGSSGCLGRSLANRLAGEGRKVIGLDIVGASGIIAFEQVIGDVCDVHLLHRLFSEHAFDAVVHCGGISGQMVAADDPYKNFHVNVFGTVNLLEVSRAHKVERFIYSSSQGAYGDAASGTIAEDTPFLPVTVYGATKGACDLMARAYSIQHGLNSTSLRIGRVYGPGRRTSSLITTMMEAAVSRQKLRLAGSGGLRVQYVYEADIVSALYLSLKAASLPQPSYNVSGPGSYSGDELAAMIRSLVPAADIEFEGTKVDDSSFSGRLLDYSAAHRDFGYAPEYTVETGLSGFLAELQSRK
jgi:UDP-glucuronate 4-epimerase